MTGRRGVLRYRPPWSWLAAALILGGCAAHQHRSQTAEEVSSRIDSYLKGLEAKGFAGAVLVAQGGQVLLEQGYGLADRERKLPVTPDTVFTVGSITKQFTAAAILKLEMQGKLNVQDPIGRFFPGVPEDKAGITLHHLLTHSAGLKENYGESDFEPVTRDELVRRVLAEPLRTKPGEIYHYSNGGYSLLAAIVEIASGDPYEKYLHDALFAPAGMEDTGYNLPGWDPDRLARGYQDGKDWGTIVARYQEQGGPHWNLLGNGGIHSTVSDMFRWHLNLDAGRILSPEALEKAYTPYIVEFPDDPESTYYGYGWVLFVTSQGNTLITHNGGNGIFFADILRFPYEDAFIMFMTSTFEFDKEAVTLAHLLFDMAKEPD